MPKHKTTFKHPTSPGAYWRGDFRWIKYPLAISQRILEGQKQTQSPGLVNIGPVRTSRGDYVVDLVDNVQVSPRGMKRKVLVVPSTSTRDGKKDKTPPEVSCFPFVWNKRTKNEKNETRKKATRAPGAYDVPYQPCQTFKSARPGYFFRLGAHGPGYYLDGAAPVGTKKLTGDFLVGAAAIITASAAVAVVSSRIWFGSARVSTPVITSEDRALLQLNDRIKDMYFSHVKHFLLEGNHHHAKKGKEPPTLVVRDNMWDLQCALLRQFLTLAKTHGASHTNTNKRVLFGYHGTSAENAEKIFKEGFRPECRRSAGAGAYFSGVLEFSAKYARDHHGVSKNSGRPTSKPEGPGDILLVVLLLDGHRGGLCGDHELTGHPEKPLAINVAQCIFDEKYVMPLARLRGF